MTSAAPAWVSYVALIASLGTLSWQVYTWRFTGPRLGLVAHDRPAILPPDSERRPLESWLLVVECWNRGRGSTRVHELWLRGADGDSSTQCQLAENSSPIPATIAGKDMARWIVSLSTLRNIPLPLNDEGALVLQPQITWGSGETLVGNEVALFLAKEGASPFEEESEVGKPTVRVDPPPEPTDES